MNIIALWFAIMHWNVLRVFHTMLDENVGRFRPALTLYRQQVEYRRRRLGRE